MDERHLLMVPEALLSHQPHILTLLRRLQISQKDKVMMMMMMVVVVMMMMILDDDDHDDDDHDDDD